MRSYMIRYTIVAVLLAVTLGIARAGLPPDRGLPLERYTSLSRDVLPDVLQRLFYAGSKQVRGYPISVVQTGGFPAVKRDGQSIALNSVVVAAMDAATEADYLASSIPDGDEVLARYLALLNDSAANFTGTDWQEWSRKIPRFAEFYRSRGGRPLETNMPYELLRQTILTGAIGSVLVRELTKIDSPSDGTDDLNRRAALIVGRAGFDAAPGTALVMYEALMNIQEKRGRPLDAIECTEARYQKSLQTSGLRGGSPELIGKNVFAFTASQRLFDRLSSCS